MNHQRLTRSRALVDEAMHAPDENSRVALNSKAHEEVALGSAYSSVKDQFKSIERTIGASDSTLRRDELVRFVARATELTMVVMEMADIEPSVSRARGLALGVYMEEEGSYDAQHGKGDQWRDEPIYNPNENTDIYRHLKHEVMSELKTNMNGQNIDFLLHNSADALGLGAILLAAVDQRSD